MKSLLALKDLTSKLKQQAKSAAATEEAWVHKADQEKEREAKYLEEQRLREEERLKKQEEREKDRMKYGTLVPTQ